MAINRVLYATQTARMFVKTTTSPYPYAQLPWILAVQTASADETIPQDDVLVLGKLGGAARLQKDVATSKASIKAFLVDEIIQQNNDAHAVSTYHGVVNYLGGSASSTGSSALLSTLEAQSLLGRTIWVEVNSKVVTGATASHDDGFVMEGVCSNISIDASKGSFPTLDIGFEGVGRLRTLQMGSAGTASQTHGGVISIDKVSPLTSQHVNPVGSSGDTVASVKFSYDMPTETLSALGGNIIGTSDVVGADNVMFSKPPFKASMTADGQGLESVASVWAGTCYVTFLHTTPTYGSGGYLRARINSNGLNISTRSFSQNVGDVGATFSVSAEGTDAIFS